MTAAKRDEFDEKARMARTVLSAAYCRHVKVRMAAMRCFHCMDEAFAEVTRSAVREARDAEAAQCIKDTCLGCAEGLAVADAEFDPCHYVGELVSIRCPAQYIKRRIARRAAAQPEATP